MKFERHLYILFIFLLPLMAKAQNDKLIVPFMLKLDPMKYVLIADFKDDPEFEGIEPQLFDDSINGKGMRVLMYRKDRKVDVYHESGVKLIDSSYSLGKGLGDLIVTEFEASEFTIDDKGLYLNISFIDKEQRKIEFYVKESSVDQGSSFLAPVGSAVENPHQLFFAYLHDFRFIGKSKTSYNIKIGDRNATLSNFPFPSFRRKYSAKISSRPLIGILNPKMNNLLYLERNVSNTYITEGMKTITNSKGDILSITSSYGEENIEMTFTSGFPDILSLENDKNYTGDWIINMSGDYITGGIFNINRKDSIVALELLVTRKWEPKNRSVLMYLIPVFRKWPTTYQWKATLNLEDMSINEAWSRKK